MTQSPRGGQAAPVDTSIDSVGGARHGAPGDDAGHVSAGSTPWGKTSTAPGTSSSPAFGPPPPGSAPGQPAASPDSPTGSVPAVAAGPARESGSRTQRPTRARGPRRARLQLRHINPWTVLKFSCVLAIALFFVWLIVVGVLYGVLDASGVIGKINSAYTTLKGDGGSAPVTGTVVFGSAAIIGVINIILFIALTTIGSVIYNLCADLVGGIEVTLSES